MLFKKSLVAAAVSATPALAHYKDYPVNTYWGQNGVGDTLGQYCESSSIDTVTLAFVNNSPEHGFGYPGTNFAAHCAADVYVKDGVQTKLLSGCSFIKEDLQKCRKLGKKIVLSIGGEYSQSSDYSLSSVEAGKEFAHYMFEMFGPYREGYTGPRPFDVSQEETFCVDGFDFDIETKFANQAPYVAMVQKLRYLISTVPEKMILSAAPQCPLDPQHFQMDTILAEAQFDRISIQFYNNPACDGRSNGFNYDAWVSWLSKTVNKNAEIFVGLPGSEAAAPAGGYLKPKAATDLICKYKKHANFGGVMIWDAYLSTQNEDCRPGETYYDVVKDALKCGGACGENILLCPKPPVPTTSSAAVSTSTSSSISTSSSASTAVTTTLATSTSSSVISTTSSVVVSTSSAEVSTTSSAEASTTSSAEASTTSSAEASTTSSAEASTTSSVGTSTSSGASSSQTSSASIPATTSNPASSPITTPATSSTATSSATVSSSTATEEDECEEETYSATVPVSTSSAGITSTASTSAVTSSATASSSTASEDDCEEETASASVPVSTLSASTTSGLTTSKPSASVTSPVPVTYPASQPESSSATGPATTEYSTSTIYTTKVHTITACPPSVTNCPVGEKTTEVIPIYTTVCPVTSEKPVPTSPAGGNGGHGSPSAPAPVPTYPAGGNGGHGGSDFPSAPAGSFSAATVGSAVPTYPAGGHGGHGSPSAPAPGATYPAGGKGEHGDDSGYPSSPAGSYPTATPGTETTKSPAVPTYPVVANYPVFSTLTKVVPVYPTTAQGNHTIPGTGTGYPVGPSPTKGSGHGGNSPAASSTTSGYPVTTAPVTAGSAKTMVSLGALLAVVLAF